MQAGHYFNPLVPGVSYMLHIGFFGAMTRILALKLSLSARKSVKMLGN